MEHNNAIQINRLASPTWRHLKMNYAEIAREEYTETLTPSAVIPTGVTLSEPHGAAPFRTGGGEELSALLDRSGVSETVFTASESVNEPLRLDYDFTDGTNAAHRVGIAAAPHTAVTAVAFYTAAHDAQGRAAIQTRLDAAEGAKIHFIQVIRVGADFALVNDIGTTQAEGAQVELTQLYLGGGEVYGGTFAELAGYRSHFQNDIGYLLKGSESLDINIHTSHSGQKSACDITAKGVLSDRSRKVFRGAIDFLRGAAGAKGAENEEVLLMSEHAVNQTLPVILCAEEDVEGSHGASIGRLDEDTVFYLMSRGLSRESIDKLMARAKIETVMRHITDQPTLDRITGMIGGNADE